MTIYEYFFGGVSRPKVSYIGINFYVRCFYGQYLHQKVSYISIWLYVKYICFPQLVTISFVFFFAKSDNLLKIFIVQPIKGFERGFCALNISDVIRLIFPKRLKFELHDYILYSCLVFFCSQKRKKLGKKMCSNKTLNNEIALFKSQKSCLPEVTEKSFPYIHLLFNQSL